jgi:hypothetical protein
MKPAAITKAESLANFVTSTGAPLKEFALALTKGEAYELLDYLAVGGLGFYANHAQLVREITEARAAGEPFLILKNFQLAGLDIVQAASLN